MKRYKRLPTRRSILLQIQSFHDAYSGLLPIVILCIIYTGCISSPILSGTSFQSGTSSTTFKREENETIAPRRCSARTRRYCLWQKRSPGCCCTGRSCCCPGSCRCRSGRSGCCSCRRSCRCRSGCCSGSGCQVIAFAILGTASAVAKKPAFGPVFLWVGVTSKRLWVQFQPVKARILRRDIEARR